MINLFAELKRRRVFRVAAIYAVASWGILQVADIFFPVLQLPQWSLTFVIALLVLGFPFAMVMAWAFDIGPGGVTVTDAEPGSSPARSGNIIIYSVLILLSTGLLYFLLQSTKLVEFGDSDKPQAPTHAVVEKDHSIAVLPFLDLSQEQDQEYFGDGIAEELLNVLVKVKDLKVASRTSSFQYRDKNQDVRQIGKELGVGAVLEGSVRTSGNRVRITAQLIDVADGYHLWSESYDRELTDIFSLQNEIATAIVTALIDEFGEETDMSMVSVTAISNVEAYQLYLRGRHLWRRRQPESLHRSIELLKQAVDVDPTFARAWSNLASAYVILPGYDTSVDTESYRLLAESAAQQALMLDSNQAEAHAVIAHIKGNNYQWTDAEAAYRAAIEADPMDSTAHHWYALFLMETGRVKKALQQAEKAYELDSLDAAVAGAVGVAHHMLGNNDQARTFHQNSKELGWGASVDGPLGLLQLRQGNQTQGAELLRNNIEYLGIPTGWVDIFAEAYSDPASRPAASNAIMALVDSGDFFPAQAFAFHAMMGSEHIFEIADQPLVSGGGLLGTIWQPEATALRRDPRMKNLINKLGLLPVWKKYGWPDLCHPTSETEFECE